MLSSFASVSESAHSSRAAPIVNIMTAHARIATSSTHTVPLHRVQDTDYEGICNRREPWRSGRSGIKDWQQQLC